MNTQTKKEGITFPVHDVAPIPGDKKLGNWITTHSINTLLSGYDRSRFSGSDSNSDVLYCTGYNSKSVEKVGYHPMIAAVHLAFSLHRPLILSPDMIWTMILQGFAYHVNNNSELLRKRFVSHEGKKVLAIEVENVYVNSPESAWDQVVADLTERVHDNISIDSRALVADFSTTGLHERLASQTAILDAFQAYYEYVVMCVCGIPSITLEGEVDDWKHLREKIELLADYDLDWWLPSVRQIADQFVRAASGDVDLAHWQDIYKRMAAYGSDLMNGWMLKLIPYLKNHHTGTINVVNPLLFDDSWPEPELDPMQARGIMFPSVPSPVTSDALPSGISMVPFTLIEQGQRYRMQLLGGFLAVEEKEGDFAMRPRLGMAVRKAPGLDAAINSLSSTCELAPAPAPEQFEEEAGKLVGTTGGFSGDVISAELLHFYREHNGLERPDQDLRILPLAEVMTVQLSGGEHPDGAGGEFQGDAKTRWLRFACYKDGRFLALETHYSKQRVCLVEKQGPATVVANSFQEFLESLGQ
ncbi:MAG: DUF4419 domain-containing protein [Cyanobacteria bacterium HKST-UBA01]|nr:DUF4419 domain-containing protein [Cyanobacteria bacterium HKST-UBA01]